VVARSVSSASFWTWRRFFSLLGAYFVGPTLQAGFVLLKRDPNNQIAADDLTA
jgi:hypothetical protein